jgi:hypothetical protein
MLPFVDFVHVAHSSQTGSRKMLWAGRYMSKQKMAVALKYTSLPGKKDRVAKR